MSLQGLPVAALACAIAAAATAATAATAAPERPGRAESLFVSEVATHQAELAKRRGRPEAAASLGALLHARDDVPPGVITPVLRKVAEDRGSDPLVAAQAAYHLALEEEQLGDDARALGRWRALGLIGDFWLLGPFAAQGRGGLTRSYPPEGAPGAPLLGARYPGKEREIGWRSTAGAFRQGAVMLDALLRPDTDAVAYAFTQVRSVQGGPAVIRLGSPGPLKVWINGQVVLEKNVVRPVALDQNAARVTLRKGENSLLIKTVVTTGSWRLFVRFTDEAGRALPGLGAHSDGTLAAAAAEPASRDNPAHGDAGAARDLGTLLHGRAARAKGAARTAAWLDYARTQAFLVPSEDADARAAETASRQPGVDAIEAQVLLGQVAREDDDRSAAWEHVTAAARDPRVRAQALSALGDLARAHRREALAITRWREALNVDPGYWPAALALASEEQAAGLPAVALARIDGLPPETKKILRVRRSRLRILEALGRKAEGLEEVQAERRLQGADIEILQELASAARNRGDVAAATEALTRALALRPDLFYLAIELGQLREGAADVAGAVKVLTDAASLLPDEPRLHEELGKLLARAGRTGDALDSIRRALVLRPQNPTLRNYADRLKEDPGSLAAAARAGAAEDLARAHAAEAVDLAKAAWGAAGPQTGAGPASARAETGAVVLLDRRVVRVHRNGLSEAFTQRVLHVRTERGARENQELYVRYTPGDQEVEIRRAQVIRRTPEGEIEVLEASGRDDRDLSEPWYGIYYDNRAQVVTFDGLRAGDVVDVQYTLADVSPENHMADYFGDFQFIGESLPKVRWDYTLIGPVDRSFFFNAPRVAGLDQRTDREGDSAIHRFTATNVPRVESEPSMPGYAEVAPYIHVSTYRSWEDVGRWYWNLIADQLTADDGLRRLARETTAGLATDEDKIRALHRAVIEGTRYVGLEFGIHGYKPYKVTQVLTRRFGDCKDKASLLFALLREVGIESQLVLVRTRRGGRVDPAPASLAVFDHAIVYVPRLSLYLDGTAEFSGMAELPHQDQGVMVLRVAAGGAAAWVETPILPSSANHADRSWTVELDPAGAAVVQESLTIGGQAAPDWRQHYQTPGERMERYGKVWNGRFPGATLDDLAIEGVEDRNQPVSVTARVRVPHMGEINTDGAMSLPVTARETDFVRSYARLSARRWDLVLAYRWRHREDLVFKLPPGWHVTRVPARREVETPFGRFELDVASSDGGRTVTVRSRIDVQHSRIAPKDYGAFRAFLGAIDRGLGDRVVLRKDGP